MFLSSRLTFYIEMITSYKNLTVMTNKKDEALTERARCF